MRYDTSTTRHSLTSLLSTHYQSVLEMVRYG